MFIPDYYRKFKCIAHKCRHNCCIGWEIDIDDKTLDFYNSLDTAFGRKICDSISYDGSAHFVLGENERCPHLKDDGLCDIICQLGEGGICDICTEHPRFYNCYDSFTEVGLGLCCEEAARIILGEKDKFTITSDDGVDVVFSEEESEFLKERQKIFDILCDRNVSIKLRFSQLCKMYGFGFEYVSLDRIIVLYKALERLDDAWTDVLSKLDDGEYDLGILENNDYSMYFENLACYFIYRHLADGLYEGDIPQRVMFAVSACLVLSMIFSLQLKKTGVLSYENVCEYARMFSSEVEYSEENMEYLLDNISAAFTV